MIFIKENQNNFVQNIFLFHLITLINETLISRKVDSKFFEDKIKINIRLWMILK
jgi:hypothetical protein